MLLAIDPGLSGGLVWGEVTGPVQCRQMPDTEGDLVEHLAQVAFGGPESADAAYIEDVPWVVRSRVSPASVGKLHRNVGVLHDALLALGVPIIRVPPRDWQSRLRVGTRSACDSSTEWKNKLKAEAQRRFPGVNVTLATADALLILDYARSLRAAEVPSNPMVVVVDA